jgi:branched-subunit amino acid permease
LTAGPIIYIGYPILIALTFCNISYKLWDFKPVKIPVLLAFLVALVSFYGPSYSNYFGGCHGTCSKVQPAQHTTVPMNEPEVTP